MPTPSLGRSNVANIDFQRAFELLLVLRAEALRTSLWGFLALPDDLRPSDWVTETERILEAAREVEERLDFIAVIMAAVTRRIEFIEQLT
ncbi:hypothetical protein NEUTE1DRAFT_37281 [Neurospora tetrasperma FGSC 2508]|uniref:Uncharacterized protein n=1 Tax=Neurospora tetrasperma (strain FGSC 2508 / ATCC MYA-4615 / P0657) TaxID=510951 RepID=F8MB17_NEUT8|nr:uncharacterized protein NEUTE1DRAFT_37281 [Neurospora tetrasperma FGSC 2508]EGO61036.1 hypothetical protein NEUTE1DRAFT_37281 [Neurospora tetrasperma FGSC 2508]EGZ74957.1 hypothetical protein NEUTE2DRAFT_57933 [Neurospora tetrasperma FGSC 2509]